MDSAKPDQTELEPIFNRQFVILWATNFFAVASMSAFFLFPLFITSHGGSKSDIGILMGAMALSSVITRPWVSQVIDRIGRKKSYLLGIIISTCMPITHIYFKGELSDFYLLLFCARIIHGLGIAFSFTASTTIIADILPKDRLNEGLGIFGITAVSGMAFGPAVAEPIIRFFGFNAFFITASLFGALSWVLQSGLKETYVSLPQNSSTATFYGVLKRKKVFGVAILAMLFGSGMAAQSGFISPYAEDLGIKAISLFFITYSLTAVITRVFGGRLADRFGEDRIVPWAFIISAMGFLSLVTLKSNWYLVLSGLICGIGHAFIFPCLNAIAVRDEPIEIRGKIAGVFTGGMDCGMLSGSILLGYIGEWFGYRPIFLTTSILLVSASLFFLGYLSKIVRASITLRTSEG